MSDLYSSGGKFQKGYGKLKRKKGSRKVRGLAALAAVLFSLVAGLACYGWQVSRAQAEFERLAAMTQLPPTEVPDTTVQSGETTQDQTAPKETLPEETEPDKVVLPQYRELSEENPDLWGWVMLPGTTLDYPVMYTPEDPEKYLYADFAGDYSYSGTPFLDARCGYDSDNLLIYGHNMNNGSMFRPILRYDTVTYWKNNPSFKLNTLYEEREYEVLAAFYDRVYYKYEDVFKFYNFVDAADEKEFDEAVAQIRSKALYDTEVSAQYGDQLVMLVTCSSHMDNGRFVLVGCYHPETAAE